MIHEITIGIICDQESEATDVLDDIAESLGMVVAETGIEILHVDPGDPEADMIDGVLVQARLEHHDSQN